MTKAAKLWFSGSLNSPEVIVEVAGLTSYFIYLFIFSKAYLLNTFCYLEEEKKGNFYICKKKKR